MRITFVLPAPVRIPMGGAKVVYAHAEGLARRGHEVTVVAPRRAGDGFRARAFQAAVWVRDWLHGVAGEDYFEAEGVATRWIASPLSGFPEGESVIATGVQSAPWVHALPDRHGSKFYFVQGLETFITEQAPQTWHYPLHRITCAEWLRRTLEAAGAPVLGVVPNAIDDGVFYEERGPHERGLHVAALYHRHPVKGPDVLIETLERLRVSFPRLQAEVFAARRPSHRLPPWVEVHVRPSPAALRALYNRAAVLLHTSRSEGWPLVPMEASACGCAVVAAANEGVQEYLTDGVSMQSAPVGDAEALAEAAKAVLASTRDRLSLVRAAQASVASYRWPALTEHLEALLLEGVAVS